MTGLAEQRFVLKCPFNGSINRVPRCRGRALSGRISCSSRQIIIAVDAGNDLQPDGFKLSGARRSAVEGLSLRQRQSLVIQPPKSQKDRNQDAQQPEYLKEEYLYDIVEPRFTP